MYRSLAIYLLLLVQILSINSQTANSEGIVVGVSKLAERTNYLNSNDQASRLVRSLVLEGLVKIDETKESKIRMAVADSYSVNQDRSVWKFRINSSTKFHNSILITYEDLDYSLNRCKSNGSLPALKSITNSGNNLNDNALTIELHLNPSESSESLFDQLAKCPILPKELTAIFAEHFGTGTSLVGTGPFKLIGFRTDKELILRRQQALLGLGIEDIVLKVVKNPLQGLTALRLGNIASLITDDSAVIEKAKSDQTLLIVDCPMGKVIARRNLRFTCSENTIDFADIRLIG